MIIVNAKFYIKEDKKSQFLKENRRSDFSFQKG